MKKQDIWMILGTIIVIFLLIYNPTSSRFFSFTDQYKLLGGFIKFFVFASFGDILSHRFRFKNYAVNGLFFKALIWGFIGIVIVLVFSIFTTGITYLQTDAGLLPFAGSQLAFAFFTSLFMNIIFAPTMMLFHRITDHYIEHKSMESSHRFIDTINTVDYRGFVTFVVFKTIPLFWIPAHTLTFMLNDTYRVFFASLLGVALGLILGIAKTQKRKEA